ncbi:MAG: stage V sporulation protein AD [Oscillospiraceae bacterium]
MSSKHLGKQTVRLSSPPAVLAGAAVVGKKEGEGPLGACFDYISDDSYFGEKTWEKAESNMLKRCFGIACDKAGMPPSSLQYIFGGDLLNQCTASSFAMRDSQVPYFGVYGACSTMAESLSLAAMAVDGGFCDGAAALSCSHFCSAERQFRFPLEYGGQRAPTAQWTVTGAGTVILAKSGQGPYITHVTTGKIIDAGVTDANNMGAAMAPAAYDTIKTHFEDTGLSPEDYDLIITGDLGYVGREALLELFSRDGVKLGTNAMDCGLLIFDRETQDVHAGGSGCGCSASVLCGMLIDSMRERRWKRMLFAATGALMSTTSAQQGESIPGICHAVALNLEVPC